MMLMKWRDTRNKIDCGVYLMRHMESYSGEGVGSWECGLTKGDRAELNRLHLHYMKDICTIDVNAHRAPNPRDSLSAAILLPEIRASRDETRASATNAPKWMRSLNALISGSTFDQIDEVEHVSADSDENEGPLRTPTPAGEASTSGQVITTLFPHLSPCTVEDVAASLPHGDAPPTLGSSNQTLPTPAPFSTGCNVAGLAVTRGRVAAWHSPSPALQRREAMDRAAAKTEPKNGNPDSDDGHYSPPPLVLLEVDGAVSLDVGAAVSRLWTSIAPLRERHQKVKLQQQLFTRRRRHRS
nr:zinc finger BED domain-containing protein RICESLEEPER 2-like [Ipomoea batatas]